MVKRVFTKGVYGTDECEFFDILIKNKIDLFIDIRMHRGMRGKKYGYVNSNYLQSKLLNIDVEYFHLKELSPTQSIRNIQKKADENLHEKKSTRKQLSAEYIDRFKEQILDNFDVEYLKKWSGNILFFCVEEEPLACHRSLVASFIGEQLNVEVKHL